MNKKMILLVTVGALGGMALGLLTSPERKAAAEDEVFPQAKLEGYVANTVIKLVDKGQDRRPVIALAVTPYGLKPGQISPTGYGALKTLQGQFPEAEWICVFIAEDSAMAAGSNWVGVAEYRQGKVTLTGGMPTQFQLDSLGKAGMPTARPTAQDLKAVAEVYGRAGSLAANRWRLSQTLLGAGSGRIDKTNFLKLEMETTALHGAAKAMGRPPKEMQALLQSVTRFYWLRAGEPL
jgi:hypothetical protein